MTIQTKTNQHSLIKKTNFRWWGISIPLLIITIIGQVDKVNISVIISNNQFLQDLNLVGKPATTGLLMTSFLFSYALSQFFWGYLIGKIGPRKSASIGIVIWAISMALSGLAWSANALIAARIILGVGEAFIFPVANTFVANWFPVKERGRAHSIWLNGLTLGPIVSGVLVVTLVAMGDWRLVFYFLAALSLLLPLPLVAFLMKDKPLSGRFVSQEEINYIQDGALSRTNKIPQSGIAQTTRKIWHNYSFWLVTLAWGFNNIFFWGWSTWMPTYFQTVRHFSFKSAGYLYSLTFLFQLLAVFIIGYISDKTMRRAPFGAVGWIGGGVLLFIGGNIIQNPYTALAIMTLGVCFQQSAFLMSQTLLQCIIPEESMGSAVGISSGISQMMAIISPTLIGFIISVSGFGVVIGFLASMAIMAGILVTFLVKEGY